jgi:two-component system response regulator NreC
MAAMAEDPTETEAPGTELVTIVIADDHAVMRDGLRLLLDAEQDFRVVAEADNLEGAVRYTRGHRPTVLILDLNLHGALAISILPTLREEAPETAVVILTMQNDPMLARRALKNGATGYVLKEAAGTELVRAVRTAATGRTYLQPELGARMATLDAGFDGDVDELSAREVEVLRLLALGHTNREIADQLVLSVRTVESHRAHLHQKLRCASRADLVRYALERHLLDT